MTVIWIVPYAFYRHRHRRRRRRHHHSEIVSLFSRYRSPSFGRQPLSHAHMAALLFPQAAWP